MPEILTDAANLIKKSPKRKLKNAHAFDDKTIKKLKFERDRSGAAIPIYFGGALNMIENMNGDRIWRYGCMWHGHLVQLHVGLWPYTNCEQARELVDMLRAFKEAGINPKDYTTARGQLWEAERLVEIIKKLAARVEQLTHAASR